MNKNITITLLLCAFAIALFLTFQQYRRTELTQKYAAIYMPLLKDYEVGYESEDIDKVISLWHTEGPDYELTKVSEIVFFEQYDDISIKHDSVEVLSASEDEVIIKLNITINAKNLSEDRYVRGTGIAEAIIRKENGIWKFYDWPIEKIKVISPDKGI